MSNRPLNFHTIKNDKKSVNTIIKDFKPLLPNEQMLTLGNPSLDKPALNTYISDIHKSNTYKLDKLSSDKLNTQKQVALSFQIMTRAEPPELVIETIKSLLAVKKPQDEILIVDNNNQETHLYQPLADYCNKLHPKLNVHFYHVDSVKGYKAGALNLALQLMDDDCTHIVVVDSDYQALPHARAAIANAIATYPKHTLLQFPQFYRSSAQTEVQSELNHYFNHHLLRSFNCSKALSTGTFAVINRSDLLALGGWSSASITEDAQMGVKMHRSGLFSQFIPEVISTGLLPHTLKDLMSQRQRWIYGNMQVLSGYFSSAPASKVDATQTSTPSASPTTSKDSSVFRHTQSMGERLEYLRAHFSQLTAWVNFTGPFIVLHLFALLMIAVSTVYPISKAAVQLPLMMVYSGYAFFVIRRLMAYLNDKAPLNKQVNHQHQFTLKGKLRTWLMHLNFWELGALSWAPVLWGQNKPFNCTPKHNLMTDHTAPWLKSLMVAPKLLLLLNLFTAVMVSPLTDFYSPALFVCAVSFLLLKLASVMVAINNFSAAKTQKPVKIATMRSEQYINTVTGQFVGPTPAKLAIKTTLERSKLEATAKLDNLGKVIEKSKLSNLEASNNQQFISKSDVTYFDKKQL
ncbi:Poly-beta-1,6-N-acetyl-D-glucosamine synthase [Psychrobacter pasteurii]|uniref:Poly-beta-1,6-N-acetyl-D-glucosamine synthase n=1 Tax=Psychrobacter pasteurii TaxID=1945520 RepID=A0A1R4EHT6_9GAMM|nr:Poly-beta-1,6-N-acetyl-D-glucosamine synthase [Psychrobacter pasteurii]